MNNIISNPIITAYGIDEPMITIGDMSKLWYRKRILEDSNITQEQAKNEWMVKVNQYKALRDIKLNLKK